MRYPRLRFNAILEFNDHLFIHRNIRLPSYINQHVTFHFNCKYNYAYKCDNNINVLELHRYDLDNNHVDILLNHLHVYTGKSEYRLFHRPNDDNNLVNLH